jgi:protein-tyrosine phosphatase
MLQQQISGSIGQWIPDSYGSRRGLVLTYTNRLYYLIGGYRGYKDVDWSKIKRVVFVCKGNICRSAFAEAVASSLGVEALSCGIYTIEGAPANEEAMRVAKQKGFSLAEHKTRTISSLLFQKNDLLVTMEPWQANFMTEMLGDEYRYTLMGLWHNPISPHIHDPYGGTESYFNKCFDYIEKSVHEIANKIRVSRN